MRVKKSWFKTQHSKDEDHDTQSTTSWQIDRETMETGTVFILGDSKITADVECNHEIKRCLLLGGKTMTNLDSIIKSITLPLLANKGLYSQKYGFSSSHVWM